MLLPLVLLAQLATPPVLPIPGATPTPMARPGATRSPGRRNATEATDGREWPTPTYQDYTPRPGATGRPPRRPPPALTRPLATPKPRPKGTPKPKPTPKPAWHPPRGTVYVDRSGLYPSAVRMRYGMPLRFIQATAARKPLALVAVDPHATRTGKLRSLTTFPNMMSADAKWTWLGDGQGLVHRHWSIAQGPALEVQPETFLALHDEIWGPGVGYLWPVRFLFYVATGDTWRRLIVTMDR